MTLPQHKLDELDYYTAKTVSRGGMKGFKDIVVLYWKAKQFEEKGWFGSIRKGWRSPQPMVLEFNWTFTKSEGYGWDYTSVWERDPGNRHLLVQLARWSEQTQKK